MIKQVYASLHIEGLPGTEDTNAEDILNMELSTGDNEYTDETFVMTIRDHNKPKGDTGNVIAQIQIGEVEAKLIASFINSHLH